MRTPKFVTRFYPRRTWYGPNNFIYLTFDDGPHPIITPWLLDYLEKENIQVSFFWQGESMEQWPDLVRKAIEAGHTVGHHGFKHRRNNELSFEAFAENFKKSSELAPHKLYRPPHGVITNKQAKYVLDQSQLVMWSFLSYDWDHKLTTKQVINHFKKGLEPKEIAVFHENDKTRERLKEIIPEVVRIVRDKGFTFAALPKNK